MPVMRHPLKVAIPLIAFTGLAEHNTGLPREFSCTGAEEEVTVFPLASLITTTGWVVNTDPLTAPVGWAEKASVAAAPAETEKELDVAPLSGAEDADKVNAPTTPDTEHPLNDANPLTAATGLTAQDSTPDPEPMARLTCVVAEVTTFPLPSTTVTTG